MTLWSSDAVKLERLPADLRGWGDMPDDPVAHPLQLLGERTEETHHVRLRGVHAPAAARRFVRAHLTDLDDDLVHTAVLLTSEIVTNALLHAGTVMELGIGRTGEEVMVTLADGKDTVPRLPRRALTTEQLLETSRGMAVIVALAADFGWLLLPGRSGKVVWFTLRIDRDAPTTDTGDAGATRVSPR